MVMIPYDRIDHGIRASLKNSRRISNLSLRLLKQAEFQSLVLYYYAIEEFGKAIQLEKSKKKMAKQETITINLNKHIIKLGYIRKYHKDLIIKKPKFIKTKTEKGPDKIKRIISGYWKETNRDIFPINRNLPNLRTGFWLVDYNEKTKRWNEHHNNFINDETIRGK